MVKKLKDGVLKAPRTFNLSQCHNQNSKIVVQLQLLATGLENKTVLEDIVLSEKRKYFQGHSTFASGTSLVVQ